VMKSPISSDAVENVGGNRDVEGMAKKWWRKETICHL
jgi:hypothetical protein